MKIRHAIPIVVSVLATAAAAPAEDLTPRITVSGSGTVQMEPDRAVLQLGVLVQQANAQAAQREASRAATAVIHGVRELGISESAIQTSTLDLQPVYSQRDSTRETFVPEVVAYRAANTIQVTIDDLALIGPAIDRAIETGANRVQGLTFSLRDDAEARTAALRGAVAEAAAKAEAIATALDKRLGAVVEVQEGGVRSLPVVARRAYAEMAADSGTPVASGQVTVTASVTAVYSLSD